MAQKISLADVDEAWAEKNIRRADPLGYAVWKACINGVFGTIGLVLFMVLFPLIAACIIIDSPGPVLYYQERVGKAGRRFMLCKFRTMDEDREAWRRKDGGNVSRIGRWLRKTHLDELPQSLNILRSEMDFIGPRPEWVELYRQFETEIPFYSQRQTVKPGIIGWAQVNFKAPQTIQEVKEKFAYDLYYIVHRSPIIDLEIILKSPKLFFL